MIGNLGASSWKKENNIIKFYNNWWQLDKNKVLTENKVIKVMEKKAHQEEGQYCCLEYCRVDTIKTLSQKEVLHASSGYKVKSHKGQYKQQNS